MARHSNLVALGALALLCACAAPTVDAVRFHNKPIVTVVNDRVNTSTKPAFNPFVKMLYHFDGYFHKRFINWTEVPPARRSANVNALDEVPDSTWFTNRIGVRDVSIDEMRRGPNRPGGPMQNKPWTIKSSKVGGVSIGFIIVDSVGDGYLLKFDAKELPEAETAADVILSRILWACGFNVAEDYIVTFKREDLVIGEGAQVKKPFGEGKPLTEKKLAESLAQVSVGPDGTIRGLASRFLSGKPLGPWPREGVRKGDPNDTIDHTRRRELRGSYAFFSWLSHTDIKGDNTLDMWVEDPENKDIRYVMHYLIDLGNGLGVQDANSNRKHISYAHNFDIGDLVKSLVTIGLWKRPWEGRRAADLVGVGLFESKDYDPGNWRAYTPSYFPLARSDRFDNFWASKILIRFSRAQLRAAVEEGQFSDSRAVTYLTQILVERQRKTAAYWFARVNPTDAFAVSAAADGQGIDLCFDDLMVKHKLSAGASRYGASSHGYDGAKMASHAVVPDASGRVCVPGITLAAANDGYTIVRLTTVRAGSSHGPTLVHLAREQASNQPRVIGVRRL